MPHALFLDTNVYLHFRSPDEVDWHALVNAAPNDPVTLVIPGVVLRELDKHKVGVPRLQQRAARVLQRLAAWLAPDAPPIRPGVVVKRALRHPAVDWAGIGLDPGCADDLLVAAALDYAAAHSDVRVVVVSDDAYPRMRAEDVRLDALAPPAAARLAPEPDPREAELREVRRKLQKLEAAQPRVALRFSGDPAGGAPADGAGDAGTTTRVVVPAPQPMTEADVAAAVETRAAELPPAASFRTRGPSAGGSDVGGVFGRAFRDARHVDEMLGGPIGDAEIARYERERDEYLEAYAEYLRRRRAYEIRTARRFVLRLVLASTGAVPAEDVDVTLGLPAHAVTPTAHVPEPPRAPEAPAWPRGAMRLMMDGLQAAPAATLLRGPSPLTADLIRAASGPPGRPNVSAWRVDADDPSGHVLRYDAHVGVAKHGVDTPLRDVALVLRDGAPVRPFQIAFTLRPVNLPDAEEGTLTVLLSPPPGF